MSKERMTVTFTGKNIPELIEKICAFLNSFKGINLGGKRDDEGTKDRAAEKPAG